MAAVTLLKGACTLRDEDQFLDYTIEVEDQQFKVHKVIMASVSHYFKVMLTAGMKESQTDRVRLEGQNSHVVADMVNFIYTGRFDSTPVSTDLLACAMYLQIPAAIEECTRLLVSQTDKRNVLRTLETFKTYGCTEGVEQTVDYIKTHFEDIMKACVPHDISHDELLLLIDNWQMSEWKLFNTIQLWVGVDYAGRQKHINGLLCQVRFGLMTPEQVGKVKDTDVYSNSEGSWQEFVVKAEEYHSLPIHRKVLDESEQTRVRGEPSPICYAIEDSLANEFYSLYNGKSWKKRQALGAPTDLDAQMYTYMTVNNYLVVCNSMSSCRSQTWYIFDPRTLTWSNMAHMQIPRDYFAVVHREKYIYALGGCTGTRFETVERNGISQRTSVSIRTDNIERYEFTTNTWRVFPSKLPEGLEQHGAGAINNCVYVAGGYTNKPVTFSTKLHCWDLSTDTWCSKTPLPKRHTGLNTYDTMTVIKLWGEDVLFVVDADWFTYYSPSADQWYVWNCLEDVESELAHIERSVVLASSNTFFLLACPIEVNKEEDYTDELVEVCVKWTLGRKGQKVSEVRLPDFPIDVDKYDCEDNFYLQALLTIPPHFLNG